MRSMPVPKNSVPPAEVTLLVQMTRNEAEELLKVMDFYHQVAGHKTLATSGLERHIKDFMSFKAWKQESK